jgi:hypothetical protein
MIRETEKILLLAKFDFADFGSLTGSTDNRFFTAVALANWLLKILALLNGSDNARLLDFTAKPAKQVLKRFFGVFACNLYHHELF